MARFYNLCERRFQLGQNKTSIRTEILAGVTTFATMSYVLATVPNMLSNAGLPKGAVLTVLIIMISVCSIAMALYTNRPFCLAPGMSSVAIVSSIFGEAGIPVEVAFGLIFLSGILFVIISFVGLRELVVKAIPASVKFSISAGIGLFIALMGLKTGDVVVAGNSNSLAFGNLNSPKVFLFVLGFVVLILLEVRKFRGSMIVSILVVTLLGIPLGITTVPETMINFPASVTEIVFRIDIRGALKPEYLPWLFTFFVPDFFGTIGILLGVADRAAGSLFCMPVMTTYLESASGVEDGGRTGMTSIVASVLFVLMLLFTPLALMIPSVATGPVLTYIGLQMLNSMKNINYDDKTESIPAFIAVSMTIFTNNIANGLSLSILSYVLLKAAVGKWREIHVSLYGLSIFLVYYLTTLA